MLCEDKQREIDRSVEVLLFYSTACSVLTGYSFQCSRPFCCSVLISCGILPLDGAHTKKLEITCLFKWTQTLTAYSSYVWALYFYWFRPCFMCHFMNQQVCCCVKGTGKSDGNLKGQRERHALNVTKKILQVELFKYRQCRSRTSRWILLSFLHWPVS